MPNENVINWITHIPNERLFLSVITIGEIRKGITKLPDSKKKYQLTSWLNTLIVVTRNEKDFAPTNVTILNPWNDNG
nr:hypothetical protein [uncultured Desulfobacter sp.]